MTFVWPWALVLLAAIPVLALGYRRLAARQAERRQQLADLGLVVGGVGSADGRRRHLGPVLLLAALSLLAIGLARPQATILEPRREGTVILAFDVSTSMAATDLRPSRMEAAKAAARRFVESQPPSIRIGVVAFGESGVIAQRPTTSRSQVLAAVNRLSPQGGTAVGRGILTSLSAIAGRPVLADESPSGSELDGADIGYYGSSAVILLSDGEDTSGLEPLPLAELASVAGVRIHPIGIGSPEGTVLEVDGFQVATALDETLLRAVAETTDGTYYAAADEKALSEVYSTIELGWTTQAKRLEVTALFAAGAAVLVLGAALLSLGRSGRVV